MAQYIDKSALVTEIERRISLFKKEKKTEKWSTGASQINVICLGARIAMLEEILSFLDTIEVKEVDEALRTEYEKGRADVIAKTCQFLNDYQEYPDHDIATDNLVEAFKMYIEL